jgi:hypothetical protein
MGGMFSAFELFILCSPALQLFHIRTWKHYWNFIFSIYSYALFHTSVSEHDSTAVQSV